MPTHQMDSNKWAVPPEWMLGHVSNGCDVRYPGKRSAHEVLRFDETKADQTIGHRSSLFRCWRVLCALAPLWRTFPGLEQRLRAILTPCRFWLAGCSHTTSPRSPLLRAIGGRITATVPFKLSLRLETRCWAGSRRAEKGSVRGSRASSRIGSPNCRDPVILPQFLLIYDGVRNKQAPIIRTSDASSAWTWYDWRRLGQADPHWHCQWLTFAAHDDFHVRSFFPPLKRWKISRFDDWRGVSRKPRVRCRFAIHRNGRSPFAHSNHDAQCRCIQC